MVKRRVVWASILVLIGIFFSLKTVSAENVSYQMVNNQPKDLWFQFGVFTGANFGSTNTDNEIEEGLTWAETVDDQFDETGRSGFFYEINKIMENFSLNLHHVLPFEAVRVGGSYHFSDSQVTEYKNIVLSSNVVSFDYDSTTYQMKSISVPVETRRLVRIRAGLNMETKFNRENTGVYIGIDRTTLYSLEVEIEGHGTKKKRGYFSMKGDIILPFEFKEKETGLFTNMGWRYSIEWLWAYVPFKLEFGKFAGYPSHDGYMQLSTGLML